MNYIMLADNITQYVDKNHPLMIVFDENTDFKEDEFRVNYLGDRVVIVTTKMKLDQYRSEIQNLKEAIEDSSIFNFDETDECWSISLRDNRIIPYLGYLPNMLDASRSLYD